MKLNALCFTFFFVSTLSVSCCFGMECPEDYLRRMLFERSVAKKGGINQALVEASYQKDRQKIINKKVLFIRANNYLNIDLLTKNEQIQILEKGITLDGDAPPISKEEFLFFIKLKEAASDTIKLRAWLTALKRQPRLFIHDIQKQAGQPFHSQETIEESDSCEIDTATLPNSETTLAPPPPEETLLKDISPKSSFHGSRWHLEVETAIPKTSYCNEGYFRDTEYDDKQPLPFSELDKQQQPSYEKVALLYNRGLPGLFETEESYPASSSRPPTALHENRHSNQLLPATSILPDTPEIDLGADTEEDGEFVPVPPEE